MAVIDDLFPSWDMSRFKWVDSLRLFDPVPIAKDYQGNVIDESRRLTALTTCKYLIMI